MKVLIMHTLGYWQQNMKNIKILPLFVFIGGHTINYLKISTTIFMQRILVMKHWADYPVLQLNLFFKFYTISLSFLDLSEELMTASEIGRKLSSLHSTLDSTTGFNTLNIKRERRKKMEYDLTAFLSKLSLCIFSFVNSIQYLIGNSLKKSSCFFKPGVFFPVDHTLQVLHFWLTIIVHHQPLTKTYAQTCV